MLTHLVLLTALQDPGDFKVFWKDGFRLETTDGNVKARLQGRIHFDAAYVGNDSDIRRALGFTDLEDGVMFRRARLGASGVIGEHIDWKAEYDFASGTAAFTDVYVGLLEGPAGLNARVGQFKEPFSLDQMNSSNSLMFMERSLADAFAPARSTGFMVYDAVAEQRVTWAAGVFKDSNAQGAQFSDGEWNVTARVTGLPVNEDEGRTLVHVGGAASLRSPNSDALAISSRPESRIAPTFVNTGVIAAEEQTLFGAEAALVLNRFSVQGEYVFTDVDALTGPDPSFSGYYVEASYFLTQDYRRYDAATGTFGRVKPSSALYGQDGGGGAWEAKARYSAIDLDDGTVAGGELSDVSVGVNWYLNPNVRIMLEGIHADLDSVGSTQIVQTRFQVDW
ncbi:MAG: porin [Planctomycetota bacterium]|nr:MAG: porin [Planctomycetota bacterium]